MAVVGTIQRGSTTIDTNAAMSATVTITSVTIAASWLNFKWRINSAIPAQMLVTGRITNSTTLTFEINATVAAGPLITIDWEVIPYTSGVTVQRGTLTAPAGATDNITITAVTLAQSFCTIAFKNSGGLYDSNDPRSAEITTSTNLQILGSATSAIYDWQVIDYSGCSVQIITATMTAVGPTSTITSIDTAKTLLISSGKVSAGVQGRDVYRTALTNATTVTYDRFLGTGPTWDVKTQVITFSDATTVQRGQASPAAAATVQSFTLSSVSMARTSVFKMGCDAGPMPADIADDHFGEMCWSFSLTSSTNLDCTRNASTVSARIGYEAVTFADGVVASTSGGFQSLLGVGR